MQSFFANIFAATMVTVVVSFPTPEAAWEVVRSTLRPDPALEPASVSGDLQITAPHTDDLSRAEAEQVLAKLDECLSVLPAATAEQAEFCASVVRAVGRDHRPFAPQEAMVTADLDPVQEAVILISAQLCRREWAAGTSTILGRVEPLGCLNETLGLAEL